MPGARLARPQKCKYADRGCEFKSDWLPSIGKHELYHCEYAPKNLRRVAKKAEPAATHENGTTAAALPRPRGRMARFVQQQNVDTATALLIAAKYPKGVPVSEIPTVIELVRTLG